MMVVRNFFFFKQKTACEVGVRLVGSEMCIGDGAVLRALRAALCPLHAVLRALRAALSALRAVLRALRAVLCAQRAARCALRAVLCALRAVLRAPWSRPGLPRVHHRGRGRWTGELQASQVEAAWGPDQRTVRAVSMRTAQWRPAGTPRGDDGQPPRFEQSRAAAGLSSLALVDGMLISCAQP